MPLLAEKTLTLVFESSEDVEQWIGWYLDGGGAEAGNYYVKLSDSKWRQTLNRMLVLEGLKERCPECASTNILDQCSDDKYVHSRIEFFSKTIPKLKKLKKQYICEDCHQNFNLESTKNG